MMVQKIITHPALPAFHPKRKICFCGDSDKAIQSTLRVALSESPQKQGLVAIEWKKRSYTPRRNPA